ncbi:putative quinol monooxygenase [Mesorhizobium sangaii]|uniref:Quinol monooxygenase YgiN n=1 Tax=Mesorhizobium sangaii TaxID=505389 RepID=A0A841PAZ4_9HYPH|nr:putative quinol monooxygenase [Mesorhizobium sangaii]MBB6409968.1 quinol monooxygenase YgiN [Mesorhizobium sangaii]
MTSHVKVVGIITARPGKAAELAHLLEGMVNPSRSEEGNLQYDVWRDQTDSDRFVIDELYRDSAANSDHRASPHYHDYLSKIGEFAERTAIVLSAMNVTGRR